MLRNASPIHLNKLAAALKRGASVTLHAPPPAARGPVKRLAMPAPVDL